VLRKASLTCALFEARAFSINSKNPICLAEQNLKTGLKLFFAQEQQTNLETLAPPLLEATRATNCRSFEFFLKFKKKKKK
jgi:hypothetical protein